MATTTAVAPASRLQPREGWELHAACRGAANPELWFPTTGDLLEPALRICRICSVRLDCLGAALTEEAGESAGPHGIRGGFSGRARRRLAGCLAGTCDHSTPADCMEALP